MTQSHRATDVSYVFNEGLYQQKEIDHASIPAGFYRFEKGPMGRNLQLVELTMPEQDRYIDTGTDRLDLERDIETFFSSDDLYDRMGVAHRRGALLYGPPGTGKTFSIIRAGRNLMEEFNVLVFLIHKDVRFEDLSALRPYFRDRSTVFVFEEISGRALNHRRRAGSDLLGFLDGELSWEHNYNIATTNYPGDLPGNLVDRPGRFDVLIEMDVPDRSERKAFLDAYLGPDEAPSDLIDRLEGFSLSYIKEMVLRSRLYDRSLHEILERFDEQKERINAAFQDTSGIPGFGEEGNGQV